MNEKIRKGLVFGILILALVWAYFNFAGPDKKKDRAARRITPTTVAPVRTADASAIKALPDSLCRVYDAKPWGKNPFYDGYRPSNAAGPVYSDEARLRLLGVLFREYKAHALINNRIVTIGDEIDGFRINEIFRDSVVLGNGDSTFTLRLTKESS